MIQSVQSMNEFVSSYIATICTIRGVVQACKGAVIDPGANTDLLSWTRLAKPVSSRVHLCCVQARTLPVADYDTHMIFPESINRYREIQEEILAIVKHNAKYAVLCKSLCTCIECYEDFINTKNAIFLLKRKKNKLQRAVDRNIKKSTFGVMTK